MLCGKQRASHSLCVKCHQRCLRTASHGCRSRRCRGATPPDGMSTAWDQLSSNSRRGLVPFIKQAAILSRSFGAASQLLLNLTDRILVIRSDKHFDAHLMCLPPRQPRTNPDLTSQPKLQTSYHLKVEKLDF